MLVIVNVHNKIKVYYQPTILKGKSYILIINVQKPRYIR